MYAAVLEFLGGYDTVLRQQIELQSEVISQFEKKREKKIEEVVVKSKEKKILDQLEGTHRERFYKDINVTELKIFDEIAVQSFNKVKK
jgi:flagellar export protein FliJ